MDYSPLLVKEYLYVGMLICILHMNIFMCIQVYECESYKEKHRIIWPAWIFQEQT